MGAEKVSLESLGAGEALGLFRLELQKVLKNIADPAMPWAATRSVSLKVTIKPTREERDQAEVSVDYTSRLASGKPIKTHIFVGNEGGEIVAYESRINKQLELKDGSGKVISIKAGGQ